MVGEVEIFLFDATIITASATLLLILIPLLNEP